MAAINKSFHERRTTAQQVAETEYTPQPSYNRKKKMLIRASMLLSVGAIVSALMYSNIQQQKEEVSKIVAERKKLEKEYETLKSEGHHLQNEIEKLNDDEYILKIARRDFFFSKEGEIIFPVESQQ